MAGTNALTVQKRAIELTSKVFRMCASELESTELERSAIPALFINTVGSPWVERILAAVEMTSEKSVISSG